MKDIITVFVYKKYKVIKEFTISGDSNLILSYMPHTSNIKVDELRIRNHSVAVGLVFKNATMQYLKLFTDNTAYIHLFF